MTALADVSALAPARSPRARWGRGGLALVAFAALAGFCAVNYAALVRPLPAARVLAVLAISVTVSCGLTWSGRAGRGPAAFALRLAIVVAGAGAGLAAAGVPAALLEPWRAGQLRDGLSQGLAGLDTFQWPYTGDDPWIRTTIVAALPVVLVAATTLAFWPPRPGRRRRWAAPLALLLLLYGTGVTELSAGSWALRGSVLLVLVAAWMWGPTLGTRQLARATALLVASSGAALALATLVHDHPAILNYRSWDLLSPGGTEFQWDQTYGPITWPRNGTLLLDVHSAEPHYWKVETLDRFDGARWVHTDERSAAPAGYDIPPDPDRRWFDDVRVDVRGLRSSLVVGSGSLLSVASSKLTDADPDGTTHVLDSPLEHGDSYAFRAYVPDPRPTQLAGAPARFPSEYLAYTDFELPGPGGAVARTVGSSAPGLAPGANPAVLRRILSSPYARMYNLARSLAGGQGTTYGVVTAVEDYLGRGYSYSESPPTRRYPLPAFLFRDRIGYCQQFSGAMALLLRMDGIPARVATGFAPGAWDAVTHSYRVRDLDAHAWVEVYFTGIGWVTFDPTPPLAPAVSRSAPVAPVKALGAGGAAAFGASGRVRARDGRAARATRQPIPDRRGPAADSIVVPLAAGGAIAAAAALAVWLWGRRRRVPLGADAAVGELRNALERLGHPCPPRTTLAQLERQLRVAAGPAAARYARALRERRYGPGERRAPGHGERTALRRALTAGAGARTRLVGLLVLPPRGGRAGRG